MSWSGWESLPYVREWSGGPPGCLGVVGGPTGCLGVVWRHSRMFLRSGRSFQMSGSYRKASRMSESGREALLDVWEWSGGPPGCSKVVGRPSRKSGSGREALLDVRKLSGGVTDVQEWSGGPPECLGVDGRPCRVSGCGGRTPQMSGSVREANLMSGSGRETLSEVREAF